MEDLLTKRNAATALGFAVSYLGLKYLSTGESSAPAPAPAGAAGAPAAAPAAAAPTPEAQQKLAGLHFEDCLECANLIADKIEERVAVARKK